MFVNTKVRAKQKSNQGCSKIWIYLLEKVLVSFTCLGEGLVTKTYRPYDSVSHTRMYLQLRVLNS